MLMECLMKLSPMELINLLYKYFQKVIDLRENSSKMEVQLAEYEVSPCSQFCLICMLVRLYTSSYM
jgi:hypothetical protein